MKNTGFYFLFVLFSIIEVRAEEAVVIEVKKTVSMSKMDKVYKNYFINGGSSLGLNKGAIVDVLRRVPFHDPIKNASIGDIRVKVGELEIIHADPRLSVARLSSTQSGEDRPVLDYETVMVGDRLDLASVRQPAKSEAKMKQEDPMLKAEEVALLGGGSRAKTKALIKEGDRHLASIPKKAAKTAKKTKGKAARKTKLAKNRK